MNWRVITALVAKDFALFFRNRFFAFVSILGVVAYTGIYFAMPRTVDETLEIGLYEPSNPPVLKELMEADELIVRTAASEQALKEGIVEREYSVGVAIPAGLLEKLATGQKDRITVYFSTDFPEEIKQSYTILLQELAFMISGQPLNIEVSEEMLGTDMAGMQIPPRDRMLPIFAIMILMTETMGLASLIAEEIQTRTVQALMITPMGVGDLFSGKGITGVGLAFAQVAILMAVAGGLSQQPFLILIALLLGAILVTGIGFLMASAGKDMLSVVAWGVPAIIILSVPSFSVIFPGTGSSWAKAIPSYYLVDTVHRVANFGVGWGDVWQNLPILLGFDVVIVWLGITALRRKLR